MATKINIKNLPTGYQSIISNGKHTIVGDEPTNSRGTDLGLSPAELVLAGLAMCKVATVRFIARKNGWENLIRDVDAQLEQVVKRGSDGLLTSVQIDIQIEGDITEVQRKELLSQADNCYINRMLMGNWEIEKSTKTE